MIIRRISFAYLCRSCGDIRSTSFRVTPYPIAQIASWPKKDLVCANCEDKATLTKVKLTTMTDVFGDDSHGFWHCPCSCDFFRKWYPKPLREAARPDFVGSRLYVKVIENGYPWRCPMCHKILVYVDERDLTPPKQQIGFV